MPHKIFVHSKARVAPAHSTHSDFSYQLAAPIEVPQSRAFVDQVHIPNEFPTIHADNKYIYLEETVAGNSHKRKIALEEGIYDSNTLPIHITLALNTGTFMIANSYNVTFNSVTSKLTIYSSDPNSTYDVWPAEYLTQGLWNPVNIPGIPTYIEHDNAYDVLGFHGPNVLTGNHLNPIEGSSHINVTPYHTLYIHSSLGTQGDSVGPMGSSSVIRTVCLDQPVGRYVHDRNSLPFDYVTVAKGMIRQLDFKLTDWRGRTVPLSNSWSFSLIFVPEDEI